MTSRLWILVLASLGLMACSQTVGDCWLIDEEGNDLGITIPDCNSTGPCDDRCFDNFEAVLITCRDVEGKTQRKTCEDEALTDSSVVLFEALRHPVSPERRPLSTHDPISW